jgi:hypothetical protein
MNLCDFEYKKLNGVVLDFHQSLLLGDFAVSSERFPLIGELFGVSMMNG